MVDTIFDQDPILRGKFQTERDKYEKAQWPHIDDQITTEQIIQDAISDIPPRPWAFGTYLLFGHAAVIGAIDGGGKGAYAVAVALSMITGRPLLNEHVWRTGPVVIITYEDNKEEWARRIAAACIHYGIDFADVKNQFHFIVRRDRERVYFAAQSEAGLVYPDSAGIIRVLKELNAALFIVDPFNLAHDSADGNSNVAIAKVASEISRIAAESAVAALVLHHLRKGSSGTVDDLMGATALRANFRATRILIRMSKSEAESLNLPTREHWRYSRIADSKENYAQPPEFATWYYLESVELGNPAGIYVSGDNVQVTKTWTPPDVFEGLPLDAVSNIFDAIRQGLGNGEFYSPDKRSPERWAGNLIVKYSSKSPADASRILKTWLQPDKKVLIKDEYYSPDRREEIARVSLNEAKVAEILGPLRFRMDPT